MKIRRLLAYRVELPLHEGGYRWSAGKSVTVFDSTVVRLETDAGLIGHGEVCPLGPNYLPAFAAGVRAGLGELGPKLIGLDPTLIGALNRVMDRELLGHPYVKSAVDMACWDILGQKAGLPVAALLGGRYGEDFALYRAISQDAPAAMAARVREYRAQGYRKFQLKVGGRADDDIERIGAAAGELRPGDVLVADANTGWLTHDALRVIRAIEGLDVYIEQPCATYEECLSVRQRCNHPLVLDESIDSLAAVLRAHGDRAMDAINLKIAKVGGLSKARQIRDLCLDLGIPMTIEDSWGGDIVTAAIAHLAHSTPPQFLFSATDFNSYVTVSIADGAPRRSKGRMAASTAPGLGVQPRMEALGPPVLDIGG